MSTGIRSSYHLKKLFLHPLTKGSFVVLVGNFWANFFNYLFHLLTGRLLGPEKYAIIAALISLFYVISFPASIIGTVVTRKMASLAAKKNWPAVKGVLKLTLKNVFYFNLFFLFLFFLFQFQIAQFLKIKDAFLVFLLGLSFAFGLLTVVNSATLQGLLKFFHFAFLSSFSAFLKTALAVLAIVLGLGVLGVMMGMVLTALVSFFLSFYFLRFVFLQKEKRPQFSRKSYLDLGWVAFGLLGMSLMINSDVMLVKHFFSSFEAGLYAALATMGKVVFFASSSVAIVLLPLATQKKEKGLPTQKVLWLSLILVFLISLSLVLLYFAFPRLVIKFFYGKNYFPVASSLGLIGIYFLFYNLAYLLVNFFISLQKKKILLLPLFFALFQIILIFFFHQTIVEVLYVLIFTAALLFLSFALYYWQNGETRS